jgi:membrane fusion protein, multidrug efflux system
MQNKKWIWGGLALLLFAIISVQVYSKWKTTPVSNQRQPRVNIVPIEAGIVQRSAAQAAISVTGSIQGVKEASISAKATGRIEVLPVKDGDYIESGQLLAKIDSRELEAQYLQAKANMTSAQANLANAARNYTRIQSLAQQGAISQQQLDTAQTQYDVAKAQTAQNTANVQLLEAQVANTSVVAPFSGYVARRSLSQGEMVSPGTILLAVVDLSKVKIEVFVSEQDIGKIQIGQPATFTVDAYHGQTFTGKVAEISPAADLKNRSFKVRIEAENTERKLKSGMFARAEIIYARKAEAYIVPKQAVIEKNGKPFVFVVKNDQVEQRAIATGLVYEQTIEIVTGIQAGEIIATFGHDTLKNGDKVSIARKGGK